MTSNIIDAIAAGTPPSEVTQEIKDVLYAKATNRIDDYRTVAAANLFTNSEEEAAEEGTEEWWSKSFIAKLTHLLQSKLPLTWVTPRQ